MGQVYKNRIQTLILGTLLVSTFAGCAFRGAHRLKHSFQTHRAWARFDARKLPFVSRDRRDFASGWKTGYFNVLEGGDGRPPVVAPRRYWDPPAIGHVDPCDQKEWLDGFRCGAQEATACLRPVCTYVAPQCGIECPACWVASANGATDNTDFASPVDDLSATESIRTASASTSSSIRLLGIVPETEPKVPGKGKQPWWEEIEAESNDRFVSESQDQTVKGF